MLPRLTCDHGSDEVLKRFLLPRPDLVVAPDEFFHNTFPSGHTTIAMTVLVAAMLVVPHRRCGVTLVAIVASAVAIGIHHGRRVAE